MNPNGTTGPIQISVQNANPLLFTFPQEEISVRPYWMVIVQTIAAQAVHRAVYRLVEGSWLTPFELGFICWIVIEYRIFLRKLPLPQPSPPPSPPPFPPRPGIIAYFIPTYILKPLFLKNVNDNTKLTCHTEAKLQMLDKVYKKYHKKIKFSITDAVHIFPLLTNTIYYCVSQASCMSAQNATTWNCYNAFGYRLYQYIFSSYFHFAGTFLMKCMYGSKLKEIMATENLQEQHPKSRKKILNSLSHYFRLANYYFGLVSSIITIIFVSCLLLPFLLTNVVPMMGAYAFVHIIYWGAMSIILSSGGFFVHLTCKVDISIIVTALLANSAFLHTVPTLISTTYSYSQYLYYGNDYFQTMSDEYNTRDTGTYVKLLEKSGIFRLPTILNFF